MTHYTRDHDPQKQEVPVDLDRGEVILDCLRPDWDILIEIQSELKQLPRVTLQYFKGHQDNTTPYHSLDLRGQLNVDADTQAGIYNQDFGACCGSVLMSPLARAHLNLPDRTVTSRYSEVLLHEATTKPLLKYIRRKHGWDASTLHSIQWDAHALAIKQTTIPHTHLVKLLHRILPTHAQANKFNGGSRTCPLCGSTREDFAHIIRCEHPTREQSRNEFLTALRDLHIQTNTSPRLSALMLNGLRQWFHSPTVDEATVALDSCHPSLQSLLSHQNQIGWDQLFMGRFCKEWSLQQQQYLANHDGAIDDLRQAGLTWQASIIRFCWQRWYTLWKARNQEVHGHDERTRAEAAKRSVYYQLGNIYQHRSMYETHVKQLLHSDAGVRNQQSLSVNRNWLSANRSIF